MEQFLCHLIGDYWLQNDWMASNKKRKWLPAIIHGIFYTLPFIFLTSSIYKLLIICISHIIIDHTNLTGRLNQLKNFDFRTHKVGYFRNLPEGIIQKSYITLKDGYSDRPLFIRIWLLIIQDNILHLVINYLVLGYIWI